MRKFLQHSRKGSALLIGLVVTILLSVMIITFFEKVLGVGQSVKSVELSTQAYYNATQGAEEVLNNNTELKKKPWKTEDYNEPIPPIGKIEVKTHTKSSQIPKNGQGNSPFDSEKNWNLLSVNEPVQLVVPSGIIWSDVEFKFRLPKMEGQSTYLVSSLSDKVIFWSFGNIKTAFYIEQSAMFSANEIKESSQLKIFNKQGFYYDDNGQKQSSDFANFYNNILGNSGCGAGDADYKCTLKFSLVKPITTTDGKKIPFIEYQITFNKPVPERYLTIEASSTVKDYYRERIIQIPQITTNTALDFAVLQ